MFLRKTVAQQLPLKRKRTDRILQDYAFLCIYASGRSALNSADPGDIGMQNDPICMGTALGWLRVFGHSEDEYSRAPCTGP